MKGIVQAVIAVAVVSVVVGVISRIMLVPVRGIQAHAFLEFGQVCLLLAIALQLKGK